MKFISFIYIFLSEYFKPIDFHQLIFSVQFQRLASAADQVDDRQQDDGSKQRDQHGRNGDRIIDCPDIEDRADEEASQECADDAYHDIE
jgi:hypothetical protein